MSNTLRISCFFMVWLFCLNCNCQCHGITTREAKSFFETRSNPYMMTNDFNQIYSKNDGLKDEKGKQRDVDNNQISWTSGNGQPPATTKTPGKNFWLTEFGETDKIITVRVSSSVGRPSWKSNYMEKPKIAALQRIGFGVEVPTPKMSTAGYDFNYDSGFSPLPVWVQQTTESPLNNESGGTYYETRIEAVSSRREVVFGKPKAAITTTPHGDYYREGREEFCEMPEPNYELPEKNYELPEKNYELPEKNYELPEKNYELPEKNYELDEAVHVMTNGNANLMDHGDKGKLGYVMEGRDFRKYRVEERTPDGFIVGEYGFIRHEDGKLHGVRYTADGSANPRLIYDALIKFLSL